MKTIEELVTEAQKLNEELLAVLHKIQAADMQYNGTYTVKWDEVERELPRVSEIYYKSYRSRCIREAVTSSENETYRLSIFLKLSERNDLDPLSPVERNICK